MIMTSEAVKQFALSRGADLVGVASVDRLDEAPAGHRPADILPGARSVVVCAAPIPAGAMDGPATSYQIAMDSVHLQLDLLATQLALFLEKDGQRAVPVPSDDPYRHWEAERSYGRGDLSHKHAAQAAGLGKLGKNSLLIAPRFGNRLHLVSVLTDLILVPDLVMDWEPCPEECTRCLRACPAGAIAEGQRVDQALCRPVVMQRLPKGTIIESCWACRKACPAGLKSRTWELGKPIAPHGPISKENKRSSS
jgi:epoxyqueuosine reductase QueG